MDKISKALQKLSAGEREKVRLVLTVLKSGETASLDIKKLKGRSDIFRVRKGKVRIIYKIAENRVVFILAIERRNDNTY
ncbi:MAG: type II toxin-antitoxin system RelE/ParE family toxin [Minisyncoccia bacterium]